MTALSVIQSLQLEPAKRFVAWGLSVFGLVAGVATACLLRGHASWRGLTTTPGPSTYRWPMLVAIASVPVWSPYVTPLASILLVGWVGSFLITTIWLFRERNDNDSRLGSG